LLVSTGLFAGELGPPKDKPTLVLVSDSFPQAGKEMGLLRNPKDSLERSKSDIEYESSMSDGKSGW